MRLPNGRKPDGQHGYIDKTLKQVTDPDIIEIIPVDRGLLPPGHYRETGHEVRQVIGLDISTVVNEWRAHILEDQHGKRYVAPLPERVVGPVQYGLGVKVNSVYMCPSTR